MLFLQWILSGMLFFTLARLLNLVWNWSSLRIYSWTELLTAFGYGLRIDLAALSLCGALVGLLGLGLWWFSGRKLYRRSLLVLFALFQLPGMIFTLGDTDYVNLQGRRLSMESLFIFGEVPGKFWQIVGTYIGLFAISALLVGLFLWSLWWFSEQQKPKAFSSKQKIAGALFTLIFIFIGARGGLQKKPLGFAQAQIFTQSALNNLVLNSSFTVVQTLRRPAAPKVKYFKKHDEMQRFLPGAQFGLSVLEGHRPEKPQNVVLIIVESLNLEYMGKSLGPPSYTPFLDSLSERSLFFERNFANARRSVEGIGALMAGVPAWMNAPFLSSQYMSNYILGIGTELSKKNYHTSFFHGGQNGTMYFDSFIHSLGIQNYFGQNEYGPQDFDGTWGVYDGKFLSFMLQKISNFPQPFFSGVFTLSSHNPFRIPDEFQNRFPKGTNEIHESIGYTDQSLREFFAQAEKQSWYKNTLFIITADHTYKSTRPEFENEVGAYRTPLIFFHPEMKWPAVDTKQITSQIDVLPSILDFLNVESKMQNDLGRSVFRPGDRSAMTYNEGRYQLFSGNFWLLQNPGQAPELFAWGDWGTKPGSQISNPALKAEMENKMKALQQYFSEGLWDNRLYYPVR